MLVDHFWLYVLEPTVFSEALGSLAFPLFAVALAQGITEQTIYSRLRTLRRLLLGALAAQLAVLLVRDFLPLNVIGTLGLGVALDTVTRYRYGKLAQLGTALAVIVLGFHVEYVHVGILFVWAVCWWARAQTPASLLASLVLLVVVAPFNLNWTALAAPLVVAVIALLPRDTPRIRDAFYYVYVMQWPALALSAALFRAWGQT